MYYLIYGSLSPRFWFAPPSARVPAGRPLQYGYCMLCITLEYAYCELVASNIRVGRQVSAAVRVCWGWVGVARFVWGGKK